MTSSTKTHAVPILFMTADDDARQALSLHGKLQQSDLTRVLNWNLELDSLLTTVEGLLHPKPEPAHNVQSLRDALRRMQSQSA